MSNPGTNSCVWLIDDDELYHLITRKNLKKTGFSVVPSSFYNGKEAFDALQEIVKSNGKTPCVIILDLNMPLYDGWDFLDWYANVDAAIRQDISLYICSSSIDPKDSTRAIENENVRAFVEKPMTTEMLSEILMSHKQMLQSRGLK